MTKEQEEFLRYLALHNIQYEVNDDIINVVKGAPLYTLADYISIHAPIPEGVVFSNSGDIYINYIRCLPHESVIFNNTGSVFINI